MARLRFTGTHRFTRLSRKPRQKGTFLLCLDRDTAEIVSQQELSQMPVCSKFPVVVLLAGFLCLPLAAQRTTATISGSLTDPSGAAVPDATVRATNTGTGVSQTARSDSQGRYQIAELQVG